MRAVPVCARAYRRPDRGTTAGSAAALHTRGFPIDRKRHMSPSATARLPTLAPHIRLFGHVDGGMLSEFFRQQREAPKDEPIVFELSTLGGDPDIGRRLAQEIRLWRAHGQVDVYFLGKTFVYSAGVTVMSAFPVDRRFITDDTVLLVHERKITKTIELQGALRACKALVDDVLAQLESGQRVEDRDFARLVQGSKITHEELRERVLSRDWYVPAAQALELGLVANTIDDRGEPVALDERTSGGTVGR
jgi:ATP-dependent Clp protease protease subunit